MHLQHFAWPLAGVENSVELAELVDTSSLSHAGIGKSLSGRDMVVVMLIDGFDYLPLTCLPFLVDDLDGNLVV